jgi:hypothetical protein
MKRATYIGNTGYVLGTMPQMIVDACGGQRSGDSPRLRH